MRVLASGRQSSTATGAGDVNLYTWAVPGGTLGTNRGLRVTASARRTTGTGQGNLKIKYGGTQIDGSSGTLSSAFIRLWAEIWADGATNAQRGVVTKYTAGGSAGYTATASINSLVSQNLTLDMDLGTDGDVWTLDWVIVEAIG